MRPALRNLLFRPRKTTITDFWGGYPDGTLVNGKMTETGGKVWTAGSPYTIQSGSLDKTPSTGYPIWPSFDSSMPNFAEASFVLSAVVGTTCYSSFSFRRNNGNSWSWELAVKPTLIQLNKYNGSWSTAINIPITQIVGDRIMVSAVEGTVTIRKNGDILGSTTDVFNASLTPVVLALYSNSLSDYMRISQFRMVGA